MLFCGGFPFVSLHYPSLTHVISLVFVIPNWLMSGCLFNPTSFDLGFICLTSWVCPLYRVLLPRMISRSLACLLVLLFCLFFFGRSSKWGCSACKHVFKIRGHLNGFWYPLSMFRSNAFLFVSLFPPLNFSKSTHCFLLNPNGNFWKTFGSEFIGVPHDLLNPGVDGSSHF